MNSFTPLHCTWEQHCTLFKVRNKSKTCRVQLHKSVTQNCVRLPDRKKSENIVSMHIYWWGEVTGLNHKKFNYLSLSPQKWIFIKMSNVKLFFQQCMAILQENSTQIIKAIATSLFKRVKNRSSRWPNMIFISFGAKFKI